MPPKPAFNLQRIRDMQPLDRFKHWVKEREAVRVRRECAEPKPWTLDHILQQYRFCNVHRMDDKVSQWLLREWYKPHLDHKNIVVACAIARYINLPSALEVIGFPLTWTPKLWIRELNAVKATGQTVFNNAYMVRGSTASTNKLETVFYEYVEPLYRKPFVVNTSSMRIVHAALTQYHGVGTFMAGQIVADLRYAMTGLWSDRHTWAPQGPGSTRGMNRLHLRPVEYKMSEAEFQAEFRDLLKRLRWTDLEAMDIQNCLCEWDKYERALWGEGKPKQRYPGKGGE